MQCFSYIISFWLAGFFFAVATNVYNNGCFPLAGLVLACSQKEFMRADDKEHVKPRDRLAASALRARDRSVSSALRARGLLASSALPVRAPVLKRKPARRFSDEDAAEKGSVRDAAGLTASGPEALCVESTAAREVAGLARPARSDCQEAVVVVATGCSTHAASSTSSTPSALLNVLHVQNVHDIQMEKESDRRCLLREIGVSDSFPISLAMEIPSEYFWIRGS